MKILVAKFTLVYNGAEYPTGSVVDVPDEVAADLLASVPKEFVQVSVDETGQSDSAASADTPQEGLPPVDAARLRKK